MPSRKTVQLSCSAIMDNGFHFFVEVKINGNQAKMIIDTGASRSIINKSALEDLGIEQEDLSVDMQDAKGIGKEVLESALVTLKTFDIEGVALNDLEVGVIDIDHINEAYQEMNIQPISGVLGNDFLKDKKAVIDFEKETLSFFS